jgi:cytochrome c2
MKRLRASIAWVSIVMIAAGCAQERASRTAVAGGDAQRGRASLEAYGCGSCHVIPGIGGARGGVGPPLDSAGDRAYIAGLLPNTPENMIAWIREPRKIDPQTAMPNVGVNESDARDIAAYLYTLK